MRSRGRRFGFTLQTALRQHADVVQLITWNDYGEGTNIEPTEEFGYQYLEMVQDARRSMPGGDFRFTTEDLRLPLKLFQARNARARCSPRTLSWIKSIKSILAGDRETAEAILAKYP